MPSTPPPPSRLRTPPTPRHGPQYDAYEPYSLRRSSRISSRSDNHSFQENLSPSDTHSNPGRSSKTPSKRATIKRTSSQTFSPPSSPISPSQTSILPRARGANVRRQHGSADGGDVDMAGSSSDRGFSSNGMPTPAKTPRKRSANDGSHVKSTARVLFPARPATNEDIMPSPRKVRKNKHAGFSLDSYGEDDNGEQIHIYTDSKERIPDEEEIDDDDNPFRSRGSTRRSGRKSEARKANGTKHGMTKEIDEAVERGEGMVSVFRGKKFFRQFTDEDQAMDEEDELGATSNDELTRRAGQSTHKPLRRRNIKPRLLFPPQDEEPEAKNDDEEALTDIDSDPPKSSQGSASTPTRQTHRLVTPPSTVKKSRYGELIADDPQAEEDAQMMLDGANDRVEGARGRKGKTTPFDTWQRTKPGIGKRPLDLDGTVASDVSAGSGKGKRVRSG